MGSNHDVKVRLKRPVGTLETSGASFEMVSPEVPGRAPHSALIFILTAALELVTVPDLFLSVTEYSPTSAAVTFFNVSVDPVAPPTGSPFLYH